MCPRVCVLRAIIGFVESFPGSLQLLVHGQQIFDAGKFSGIFADQKNYVFHLDAALPPDGHGFVGHLRDELDHQVLQDVHGLCVRVLVVTEAVHHAAEFLREEPFPSAVASGVHPAGAVLQLLLEARLVLLLRHYSRNKHKYN